MLAPFKITAVFCLIVCMEVGVSGCSTTKFFFANAPTAFDRVERHPDQPYGQEPRQTLDIYARHGATNRPVVIFWYGGSWNVGKKSDYRFVGAYLAEKGFVAVLPDYRLYPKVIFPAFDEDGAHAVAWVEQHINEFGGDPRRIVLMGHSAGAHTAAFLAYNHDFLRKAGANPTSIVGVVGLSGPYVLTPDPGAEQATFPSPPFKPADYQPIAFVDDRAPPTLLLHGLKDKEVYPKETLALRDALLAHHVRVEVGLYPHRYHGDTVAPFAPLMWWRDPAAGQTVEFIRSVTGQERDH